MPARGRAGAPRPASRTWPWTTSLYGLLAEIFGAGHRLQQGHGRLDARLLPALRHLPQQRHRRRLRRHRRRRGAVTRRCSKQPGHRHRQHRRRLVGLRPRLGRHALRHHGPVQDALGAGLPRRPAPHLRLHEQLLRHGRPDPRRDHGLRASGAPSAAGLNPGTCTPRRVDGNNPLAVIDAIRRKKAILASGRGPRAAGHRAPTARAAIRPATPAPTAREEEIEAWQAVDAIQEFRRQLLTAKAADEARVGCRRGPSRREDPARRVRRLPTSTISPRLTVERHRATSCSRSEAGDRLPGVPPDAVRKPLDENNRVQADRKEAPLGHSTPPPARSSPSEGDLIARRHLRGCHPSRLPRQPAGHLRRGEPRLGWRLRRLPRPDRKPALPPPLQLAHLPRGPSSERRSATPWKAGGPSSN